MHVAIIIISALCNQATAHYLFGRLIFDNHWTKTWEYVREISPYGSDPDLALVYPNTEPNSVDLRCGRNASISWNRPKTATVHAGDRIGFAVGEPKLPGSDPTPRAYHPGYASAWLSKSPTDDLNAYQGDGDWFKILNVVGRTEQSLDFSIPENKRMYNEFKAVWGTFNVDSWNFTIPKTTPSGKYLVRFEHVFPNPTDTQFYVNCAHLDVINIGGENGNPSPLAKIPGIYKRGQPDVYFDHYNLTLLQHINEFVPPAPTVWSG